MNILYVSTMGVPLGGEPPDDACLGNVQDYVARVPLNLENSQFYLVTHPKTSFPWIMFADVLLCYLQYPLQ